MSIKRVLWILTIMTGIVGLVAAQADTCPMMVETALEAVGDACNDIGRNEVCYGNNMLTVLDFDDVPVNELSEVGDSIDISGIGSITTAVFDLDIETWGVAVLVLQADLPDSLPGQNVTFVVFGDTQVTSEFIPEEQGNDDFSAPMQVFSLSTGVGQPECEGVPPDGVLIQSPADTTVHFLINGIEVEIGSTVFIEYTGGVLIVTNLDGSVTVTHSGVTQMIEPGYSVSVSVDGEPGAPIEFNYEDFSTLPVILLPDPVGIPVLVRANNAWRDTGIAVDAGDTFTLLTGGVINFWDNCEAEKVANGQPDIDCDSLIFDPAGGDPVTLSGEILGSDMSLFPVPAAPPHSLVGRIGSSTYFVGNGGDFTAAESGTLEFRANDVDLNNLGAFFVSVVLHP